MNTSIKFVREYIKTRGGTETLSEDEKTALVVISEGLTRSSDQKKLENLLSAVFSKSKSTNFNKITALAFGKGMDPKEIGEALFDALDPYWNSAPDAAKKRQSL